MPLRLLQITLPVHEELDALLDGHPAVAVVDDCRGHGLRIVQVPLQAEKAESVMDELQDRFADVEGFHLLLLPIEALLPRLAEDDEEAGGEREKKERSRLSREELYADVTDGIAIDAGYLALVALSAVVAAVGLLRDDVAVVIGAMVIAPLLKPNIALALASTLGDPKLAWRSLQTNATGAGLAFALSWGTGLFVEADPGAKMLAARTTLGLADFALALAAGAAGTLAFTRGLAGAVIGVMVAVALLPPLVASGVLFGAGATRAALGALLLTGANLVCVNLAAIATFLLQGVRPHSWSDSEKAKKATGFAVAIWLLLLAALAAIVSFAR